MSEDRSLERIASLLNQAEGTDNEAEAAAFMEAAQRLATLRGVDLAKARYHTKSKEQTVPEQRSILIGQAGTKGLRTLVDLYIGIAHANDVKVTIAHNATRVYAYGFAEDIDMSERLFASLMVQMVTASRAFLKTGAYKQETYVRDDGWYYERKPVSGLTARLEFQSAFSGRIGSRLSNSKREAQLQEIEAERQAEKEAQFRADNPHLDEDGNLTLEFMVWFYDANDGYDLTQSDRYTADLVERLTKDLDNDWTRQKVAQFLRDEGLEVEVEEEVGTSLVLASKAEELDTFYKSKTGHIRGSYKSHQSSKISQVSRDAGRSAADNARLSGSQALPGARKGLAS